MTELNPNLEKKEEDEGGYISEFLGGRTVACVL